MILKELEESMHNATMFMSDILLYCSITQSDRIFIDAHDFVCWCGIHGERLWTVGTT